MQKAQYSTQWGLPPGSKKRFGKGGIKPNIQNSVLSTSK